MSRDRLIRLNGFKQATVSHAAVGAWRHPQNQSHRYRELDYWIETARTLEDGLFDGLFIADVLGVLDTYGGSIAETLKQGVQTPSIDPVLAISAMAAATRHLGFAVTLSTTYEQPYNLARKLTTLDHLTGGRIGWNIVTSALDSAARNLGLDRQVPHRERYRMAEEFLDVTYKLWEGSWEAGAVVLDREAGIFAAPLESPSDPPSRAVFRCAGRISRRALAAKDTGPVPGRFIRNRTRFRRPPCRRRVHRRSSARHRPRHRFRHSPARGRFRPRSLERQIFRHGDRDHRSGR